MAADHPLAGGVAHGRRITKAERTTVLGATLSFCASSALRSPWTFVAEAEIEPIGNELPCRSRATESQVNGLIGDL
jgi:hypothetical protein